MINPKTVQTDRPKLRKKALKNLKLLKWFQYQIYRRTLLMNPYGILMCNENRELDVTPDKPVNIKKASPSSIRYLKALCRCRYIVRGEKTLPAWFRPRKEQIILDSFCDLQFRDFPLKPVSMPHLRKIYKTVQNFYFQAKRAIKDLSSKVILYTKAVVHSLTSPFYSRGFFLNSKMRHLLQYKNKHTGQRCFLIGNGPSLKAADLELLRNEYCFAANRIYEIFPDTSWRPSCYFCADSHIFRECMGFIARLELPIILLHEEARKYHMEYKNSSITYINNFYPFFVNRYKYIHGIKISPNVSHYFTGGETVTFLSIQLALYMGFKKIYLLGVDHNYSRKLTSTGQMIIDHSIKDYFGNLQSQDYNIQNIDTSTAAYKAALDYCQKNNITIKNATRGGKLEVFPRISFDSLVTDC